jgi:O-acetyl-ADP-ribose deacetylase (regulator of RNase III)
MTTLKVLRGDITKLKIDAIVNAANSGLRGGGGVDGAIHRAGGPAIMEACRKIGSCPTGEAVITTAGKLPAQFVIHTVGPIWQGGNHRETQLLRNAYTNSLELAAKHALKSIAFPNISTGVYGFPKSEASKIAINSAKDFLMKSGKNMEIIFVCFDAENHSLYKQLLNE